MLNNQRTYGIEIEAFGVPQEVLAEALNRKGIPTYVERYNHSTRNYWKIVTDASIHGDNSFELVSPPLKGKEGMVQIRRVCQVLYELGAQVNKSCGLHIHHDVRDLNLDNFRNLFTLYARFEATIDGFFSPYRRGNHNKYCLSLQNLPLTAIRNARTLEELQVLIPTRYYKVNIYSFWRQGTLEFRHASGTIDPEKIINWIILTQLFIERSKRAVSLSLRRTDSNLKQLQRVLTRGLENKKEYTSLFKYYQARTTELLAYTA